ncbi:MAG TPA: alpha/beta fold hydrolase, partial [Blastocatellia bacterium]|nr:alpha/beta fold hydrolase [Blastocatellia bacterium]
MNNQSLPLFHRLAPSRGGLAEKPPLLLLLHGFGADENDLLALAPALDERFLIVSVRAPVTLGAASYAWFSLGFTPEGITSNLEEAENSLLILRKFITELAAAYHCDPGAVYLMGFSQGAMMSLAAALTTPGLAAGVVAMSGRVFPQTIAQITDPETVRGLPI